MEKPTIGKGLRTLFWFLVLAMTCRFGLVPALAAQFKDVILFRLPAFGKLEKGGQTTFLRTLASQSCGLFFLP